MHPTVRLKRKLNAGEMADNRFKRQEAPSGVFLLATLHPMSEVPPCTTAEGYTGGTREILGWGQEGYRYCFNDRDCVILQQDFQSLIYLQSDRYYLVIVPTATQHIPPWESLARSLNSEAIYS